MSFSLQSEKCMKKRKSVLILTERFFPEEFLINDLASEWHITEDRLEILTQVPSYPFDKITDGYSNKLFQTTTEYCSIPVHRVKTILGYNRSVVLKILNYLSFAFLTSMWAVWNGWKYKKVFIYHTGPLTMATASIIFRRLWRCHCVIWTQDLWPDSVYAYGFKPTWWKRFLLNTFVKVIYSSTNVISVSSKGFIARLQSLLPKRDICYIPQWSTGFSRVADKPLTDKIIFMFAGNIGSVQNLEMVLSAFHNAKLQNAELHFVGDGVYLEKLRQQVENDKIRNVIFHGRHSQKEMVSFYEKADVLLLSLKPGFSMTLPGKFQTYLTVGRPLFGVIDGEAADLIKEYDLGLVALPESKESVIRIFLRFSKELPEKKNLWSKNCLLLAQEKFSRERNSSRLMTL